MGRQSTSLERSLSYNFRITNPDGTTTARLDDPHNPTMTNTATNVSSVSSMVYIPYNKKTMGKGNWLDRSVEIPRNDKKTGTVETVAYTGVAGDIRGLAVYLPDGAVANITDNLIADGTTAPFVVVTMNNQDLNWDYKQIEEDQFEYIMPYVEANYHVSNEPASRAYAGLSMGGMTANRMYFNHADDFAYFGIWSYAVTGDELSKIGTYSNLDDPSVMVGVGIWDYLIEPVQNLHTALKEEGIEHAYVEVPAAHDWKAWHLLYATFVEDYLWEKEKEEDKKKKSKSNLSHICRLHLETSMFLV